MKANLKNFRSGRLYTALYLSIPFRTGLLIASRISEFCGTKRNELICYERLKQRVTKQKNLQRVVVKWLRYLTAEPEDGCLFILIYLT